MESPAVIRRPLEVDATGTREETHTALWIRSAGHPASEGENPHTEVFNQMRVKEA